MPEGPWLGIDYGTRRIGIAFLGESALAAQPLGRVHNGPNGPDWLALDRLIQRWQPRELVIGLPRRADGSEGSVAQAARRFAQALQARHPLPLHWIDERLSSYAAEALLQERGMARVDRELLRDSLAACAIVQSYHQERSWSPAGI